MKRLYLTGLIIVLAIGHIMAKRYFVSSNGSGNGSSWQQSFNDLQQALGVAIAGDEIWVATGIYKPSQSDDPTISFRIPSGIALYGGFKGTETQLQERDWSLNKTVLSGNLGEPQDSSDNSNTIVYFNHASPSTIFDGFVLVHGTAKGFVRGADPVVVGAAIFNNGSQGNSSPTIRNCIFQNNFAREGAAIYNYAHQGKCNPKIINCQFIKNIADFNGGAIFNNGDNGICNPKIINCSFEANQAIYGGSIHNSANGGLCNPLIAKSIFTKNLSSMSGSVIFNKLDPNSKIYAILDACQINDNRSTTGNHIENNNKKKAEEDGVPTKFER